MQRAVFGGIIPAVVAVILQAGWNIARKNVTGVKPFALAAAAAIILIKGFYVTLAVIFIAGLVGPLLFRDGADAGAGAKAAPPPGAAARVLQWSFSASLAAMLLLFLLPLPDFIRASPLAHVFTTFSGMSLTLFGAATCSSR